MTALPTRLLARISSPPVTGDMGASTAARGEDLPLTRRELLFIAGFWMVFGFLTVANRLFGGRDDAGPSFTQAAVVVAFVESFCWSVLTPLVFSLAARAGRDRATRTRQLVVFSIVGIAVAYCMSNVGTGLRGALFPPRRNGNGPPLWFAFINAMVIYGGVLAAGLARAYSQRYRMREQHAARLEAQLAGAQLDALRRQLDPHFLFNTLNLISSLVERDPRGVRRMIARLSELLRFSLEGASAAEIPLRDELALLERYLDIMRMRFDGRLDVVSRIDERTLDALVPSLVLQPLVENAIKHGVERLRDAGRIEIEAMLDGETVVLRVRDNGPERPPSPDEWPAGDAGARTGVGLRNTTARLAQLYGAGGGVTLRRENGGTVAEVRVPHARRESAPRVE